MRVSVKNPLNKGLSLELNLVRVLEAELPTGCAPVEWRLATTEPVDTPELAGHLKRNGDPGWVTLGRGYERLLILEEGWTLARPRDSGQRCDQS
jgi:hypothetical protein